MKKIIIAVVALLLLAGGGFGGLYFTNNLALFGLDGLLGESAMNTANDVKEESDIFVSVDQIIVPVLQDGRVAFQIYLNIKLGVEDNLASIKVRQSMPRIQDAIIVELVTRPVITRDGSSNIDVLAIKSRVLKAIHKTYNGKLVQDVLISQVVRGK